MSVGYILGVFYKDEVEPNIILLDAYQERLEFPELKQRAFEKYKEWCVMGNRFASGKIAIAMCDRCGFRFRLRDLQKLIIKTKQVNLLVFVS